MRKEDNQDRFYLIVGIIFGIIMTLFLSGCSGTGLDKQATLMPDSVTISLMQEKYKSDPKAWRGGSVSATWEFK